MDCYEWLNFSPSGTAVKEQANSKTKAVRALADEVYDSQENQRFTLHAQ